MAVTPVNTPTRRRVIDAAVQVVSERGAAALTLEAVAEAAGVSKGGLLYHFPSKEALVGGMVEALCDRFEEAVAERSTGPGPGRSALAYLAATAAQGDDEIHQWQSLCAAFLLNPDQLNRWRDKCHDWRREDAGDGGDPVDALILRLAADGLWLSDMYNLYPLTAKERRALLSRLEGLSGERGGAP
jgi:AcrR family transcriptional regulator